MAACPGFSFATGRLDKEVSEMVIDGFFDRKKYLKHQPALLKKQENGTFIMSAISQKDHEQEGTDVALPSEQNVKRARDWVNHNEK